MNVINYLVQLSRDVCEKQRDPTDAVHSRGRVSQPLLCACFIERIFPCSFSCCCPAHARSVGSINSLQGEVRSTSTKSGMETEYAFEVSKSLAYIISIRELGIFDNQTKSAQDVEQSLLAACDRCLDERPRPWLAKSKVEHIEQSE